MTVARPRRRTRARLRPARIALHAAVLVLCACWFTPVLALLSSSFRPGAEISASGWWHVFLQPRLTTSNYTDVFATLGLGNSLLSTLAMAVPTTLGTVLVSAFGAYVLARMRFPGRLTLAAAMVALQALPPQLTLVPVLQLFNSIGITGSLTSVWLYQIGSTVPFGVFLLRGFFADIPESLLEAARIDGASEWRIFWQIVLPTSGPILAALAILQFLWSWNDLLIPLLFLGGSSAAQPLTVQVAGMVQSTGAGENLLIASAFLSVVVPLAVLLSLQKFFVRGILGGSVKG
ncbi:carbohydrate ABC transporter permease [Streptomyces sp. NPDC058293]|uniref:carbohydrate ABC transporter permease n=1 Tax=Streptomyces sp. NPDC058293 TaxID=3346429 RepID=UPI0036ED74F4